MLLHGYNAPAVPTWADTRLPGGWPGHRVIMPDLRGHGASVPANGSAYPPDALTADALTLIAHLDLGEYDLGGYSLGARIVARALTLGAKPGRAFIAGTGLDPIVRAAGRGENYRRILATWARGNPARPSAVRGLRRAGRRGPGRADRILDTFVDTAEEDLARVEVPTLVIAGDQDTDHGSVEDLAAVLPHARLQRIPGDHFGALVSAELTDHLARFLSEELPPAGADIGRR